MRSGFDDFGIAREELPAVLLIGQEQELKDEAQTELESVAIAMIQHALAIVKVVFPLKAQMGCIIDIPVHRRAG